MSKFYPGLGAAKMGIAVSADLTGANEKSDLLRCWDRGQRDFVLLMARRMGPFRVFFDLFPRQRRLKACADPAIFLDITTNSSKGFNQ
jgi:hypothetical protein